MNRAEMNLIVYLKRQTEEVDEPLYCEMCGREIPPEDGHSINAPGIPAGEIIACTKCRDDYRNRNRKEEE